MGTSYIATFLLSKLDIKMFSCCANCSGEH